MTNNQSVILSNHFHKILPDLDFDFNISSVCVFGQNGNKIILITNEDNVFAFGDIIYGCLGFGNNNTVKEPTKINELCNKNVIHISYGNDFIIALTKSGQCFSWGLNYYGMLGNGTTNVCNEPKLINALSNEVIIAISCGFCHSLVLTLKGSVYGFGYNKDGRVGVGNNLENQLTPIKVKGLDSMKIVSIACGGFHSLALTENGDVFSWGNNCYGQLGIGNNTNQDIPIKINLNQRVIIKQITCGSYHSLLLSSEGDIYAFGYNEKGSLGNGNDINQNTAIKLSNRIKFYEISSHSLSNISIALSQKGFCYVWGECDGEVITTPKETQIQSIANCFVIYSKVKRTKNLMRFHLKSPTNRITESLVKSFNNPERSNLKIKVENKCIYVNKSVLILLCKYFKSLLSENFSESETNELEITQYSYSTYYSFLKYIYTDSIDVSVEEAIDLFDLANNYWEEELKEKCIQIIKNGISIENFCTVYSFAVKYESQEVEKLCWNFASNKMKDINKTETFQQMERIPLLRLFNKCFEKNLLN